MCKNSAHIDTNGNAGSPAHTRREQTLTREEMERVTPLPLPEIDEEGDKREDNDSGKR